MAPLRQLEVPARSLAIIVIAAIIVASVVAGVAIDRVLLRSASAATLLADTSFHPLSSALRSPTRSFEEGAKSTMSVLPLTIGLNPSPYTQALFDGSVRPKGVELNLQSRFGEGLDNVGARHRAIIAGELDGGELSISSFILARLRGVPLKALPSRTRQA